MTDTFPTAGIADSSFQTFIDQETQNQRFQSLVHGLTERCWDLCMDKPSIRLESKTENCMVNCVGRFLDTNQLILNRLEKTNSNSSAFE